MNYLPNIDRRSFVVGAATLGGGLALAPLPSRSPEPRLSSVDELSWP